MHCVTLNTKIDLVEVLLIFETVATKVEQKVEYEMPVAVSEQLMASLTEDRKGWAKYVSFG